MSDAAAHYGMDRQQAISEAGLDAEFPSPEPGTAYGPLSGIWLSSYEYQSNGRDATYTGRHYVIVLQQEAALTVRSLPGSKSTLTLDLSVNGRVATGKWAELTQADGYYRGAVYTGSLQLIATEDGRTLSGSWAGFGKEGEVNTGAWSLTLVNADMSEAAIERWNRAPHDEGTVSGDGD